MSKAKGLQAVSPAIAYLDGRRLDRALRAGIRRVLAERQMLNRINVFPVPDGDTGTNLGLTLGGIGAALAAKPSGSAGTVLVNVADAALDGARGNSGAILAQFFQGLADALGELERISTADLAKGLELASAYSRDALSKPLDGTVLTVIHDVALAARALVETSANDFVPFLAGLLAEARLSLAATQNGLEAMRKAGVVDAGASGFVMLLEGMAEFLTEGSLRQLPELPPQEDAVAAMAIGGSDAITFRYCTECMLTGTGIDRRRLRETLSELGDSLVIAGTHRKLKIHIHSNNPDRVFTAAGKYGEVGATKADDMRQQARSIGRSGLRAAVVTDSAADLPEYAYESMDIHFVPLRINFGERSYMDKVSLPPAEFFAELRRNPEHPQTSQPAPGDFRRVYEFLSSHFEEVISISLSRAVSGTWQAATNAAERCRISGHITVIDSRNVSVGQGLIAMAAAELVQAGCRGAELIAGVERAVLTTQSFGLVPDLTWAVRGGRVPGWLGWLAGRLGLVPILRMDQHGQLRTTRVTRRNGDLVGALANQVKRQFRPNQHYRLGIGHADRPAEAERLRELLQQALADSEPPFVVELGAAIGAHGGAGTLMVSFQEQPVR